MAHPLKALYRTLVTFGFDPRKTIHAMRGLPFYLRDLIRLRKQRRAANNRFAFGTPNPCLEDRFAEAGSHQGHYFHQDLLVARRIYTNQPTLHVDVGSRFDGFVAHVASFRPLEVIDIRPLLGEIPNVKFIQADLMATVRPELVDYCDSLSCLHALEHFGLGRYGDPVNYDGDLIAFQNLSMLVKRGGKFYFSVPIGPQRIEFNAHRVFSVKYLLELFQGKFLIDRFSYVDDRGDLHENVPLEESEVATNFDCRFGCGIFELTKL
jgi:SAM-dependent methyltransferase